MKTITIDDKTYDVESLSDDSKAQLASLQYVDSELRRLQAQAAALQTARIAYGRALKQTLEEGKAAEQDEVSIQGLGIQLVSMIRRVGSEGKKTVYPGPYGNGAAFFVSFFAIH